MKTRLPESPIEIVGDKVQLRQCLANIMDNAILAVEDRPKKEIEIAIEKDGPEVRISISDTGPGIEPENLQRIFEPFYTTRDVGQGSGLGLAISHGIASRHSGRIEVKSTVGEGSTFTVILPIHGPSGAKH